MSFLLWLTIVGFGLICLALGVVRLLLNKSGVTLAIFLGIGTALCLGYFVVAMFFVKVVSRVPYQQDPATADLHALEVPESKPLIDLSDEIEKDKDRPEWVESEPVLEGDVYKISVASDPKLTPLEAEQDLADKTYAATEEYLANLLDQAAIASVTINRDFIAEHIQKEEYFEQVDLPVSKMVIAHGLLVNIDQAGDMPLSKLLAEQRRYSELKLKGKKLELLERDIARKDEELALAKKKLEREAERAAKVAAAAKEAAAAADASRDLSPELKRKIRDVYGLASQEAAA